MGSYNKSLVFIGILFSVVILTACNLSLIPPIPITTPTAVTLKTSTSTPTTAVLPTTIAALPSATLTPLPATATATNTATPQPANVIYVVVTATSTPKNALKPQPASQVNTGTKGNQQITLAASPTSQLTSASAIIVPSATPIPPTATTMPATEWTVFPWNTGADYPTNAIYQPFEHGFMVWRSDFNCVYVIMNNGIGSAVIPQEIPDNASHNIHSYGYCLKVAPLTDRSVTGNPPAPLLEPTGAIGKVWRYYAEVRDSLGYATAPEQSYQANGPTINNEPTLGGGPWSLPQLTLPDGSILACGVRGATARTCPLRNG